MADTRQVQAPTLSSLAAVLPQYGTRRFDVSWAEAVQRIGGPCDPSRESDAIVLRTWLNKWLTRIAYPRAGEPDLFAESLREWWATAEALLPGSGVRLTGLTEAQIDDVANAYGDLVTRVAAQSRSGAIRCFRPTATAKILMFTRPLSIPAWDKAIAATVSGRDSDRYAEHLRRCQSWAQQLVAEAAARGLDEDEIGPFVGRDKSTVAKLMDEWLYATVTGGFGSNGSPK